MADTVFSVRIDEELKNRFMELAQENGVNNKDLMQLLVTQFELGQIGEGNDGFAQTRFFHSHYQVVKRTTASRLGGKSD